MGSDCLLMNNVSQVNRDMYQYATLGLENIDCSSLHGKMLEVIMTHTNHYMTGMSIKFLSTNDMNLWITLREIKQTGLYLKE